MSIRNSIQDMTALLTEWRQDIHAHPELAFEETRTSKLVQQRLKSFGITVHTGFAGTGVVGVLKNGTSNRCIGFRADMDALPIYEQNEVAYKSTADGKMHACGHDGHTTVLLGVAKYLADTKNFNGTVYFYFQPAEEAGGGANIMIQDGLFEHFKPDQVYALHTSPMHEVGEIAMVAGSFLAAPDAFTITIQGKGGHAAMPHLCVDPIYAGVQICNALQSIVSRKVDPLDNMVVTITRFHGGDAYNVIPDSVEIWGTVRTMKHKTREYAEHALKNIAITVGHAHGVTMEVKYDCMYPPTINDETATEYARQAAVTTVGKDNVSVADRLMGGEDFSYMLEQVPGCMVCLGNGKDSYVCHHPKFNFNDTSIPYGVEWFVNMAEQRLAK